MISTIRVEVFGSLAVWADGRPLREGAGKPGKPWQLLCFLLLKGGSYSPAQLADVLWTEEEKKGSEPVRLLNEAADLLRREFGVGPGGRCPVVYRDGMYQCNPEIAFVVDARAFEETAAGAEQAAGDERLALLMEAAGLYKGALLPQLNREAWVLPLATSYRQCYGECTEALCAGLEAAGRYSELLDVAAAANRIYPLEERGWLYLFRALYALEEYRDILPAYNRAERLMHEQLDTEPCQEIKDIREAAAELVDAIEQDMIIIKEDLREVREDYGNTGGPLFCTYDVFKYLYQMVARSSERAGGSVVVMLLGIVARDDAAKAPTAQAMSDAMEQVRSIIMGGLLRKSDTLARYSPNQYIIMLTVEKAAGAEPVIERIRSAANPVLEPAGLESAFATTVPGATGVA